MSYTDMDIEMKALSMLGESVPDEDADMLRAVCSAAAAELESRLRRGASSDEIGETFVTASAMLAISMYMELGQCSLRRSERLHGRKAVRAARRSVGCGAQEKRGDAAGRVP